MTILEYSIILVHPTIKDLAPEFYRFFSKNLRKLSRMMNRFMFVLRIRPVMSKMMHHFALDFDDTMLEKEYRTRLRSDMKTKLDATGCKMKAPARTTPSLPTKSPHRAGGRAPHNDISFSVQAETCEPKKKEQAQRSKESRLMKVCGLGHGQTL